MEQVTLNYRQQLTLFAYLFNTTKGGRKDTNDLIIGIHENYLVLPELEIELALDGEWEHVELPEEED